MCIFYLKRILKILKQMKILLLLILHYVININGFTVDILNITKCLVSSEEIGELVWDIDSEESVDQQFTGKFDIPIKLDRRAYVEFESYAWDNDEDKWFFLFNGLRSLCNSVIKSLPYKKFQKEVRPRWPNQCPISADTYNLDDFPISGQYVVLSDIRNISPLVKHKIKLWQDDELILCRIVHTISSN